MAYAPPPGEGSALKYRLVKLGATLGVQPSLKAAVHVRWSEGGGGDEVVVAIEARSAGSRQVDGEAMAGDVELASVLCISNRWSISSLSSSGQKTEGAGRGGGGQRVWLLSMAGFHDQTQATAGCGGGDKVSLASVGEGGVADDGCLGGGVGTALGALVVGAERGDRAGGGAGGTRMVLVWRDRVSNQVGDMYIEREGGRDGWMDGWMDEFRGREGYIDCVGWLVWERFRKCVCECVCVCMCV